MNLKIRLAEINDSFDIFSWRTDKDTISMSGNSNVLVYSDHKLWYSDSLINPNRKMYIGLILNQKIGVIRFDYNPESNISEISINLNPKMRGKGLSKVFLYSCLKLYRANFNDEILINSRVKKNNLISIKLFNNLNFFKVKSDNIFHYFNLII